MNGKTNIQEMKWRLVYRIPRKQLTYWNKTWLKEGKILISKECTLWGSGREGANWRWQPVELIVNWSTLTTGGNIAQDKQYIDNLFNGERVGWGTGVGYDGKWEVLCRGQLHSTWYSHKVR